MTHVIGPTAANHIDKKNYDRYLDISSFFQGSSPLFDSHQGTILSDRTLCWWEAQEDLAAKFQSTNQMQRRFDVPVPPRKKVVNLLLFFGIIKKFEDAVVESFGIGDGIGTRKHGRGA
jgi:hypothetical protein